MENYIDIIENKKKETLKKFFQENWINIEKKFKKRGIILFRGFKISSPEIFNYNVNLVHKKIKNYTEASTPRTKVGKKVYTSTEYPKHKDIPLHNEMSYSKNYPKNLWFFCSIWDEKGGETPIANSRSVLQEIDPEIVNEFKSKKIKYVRRFGYGIDLSCEDVFGTNQKDIINKKCEERNVEYEWEDENKLITKETNQVTIMHPYHKFEVWFNQAHLFHHTNLEKRDIDILKKLLGEGVYSRDVVFGDDTEIPDDMFENIRKAYKKKEKKIEWQSNDLALIDNLHIAHGRKSFSGTRKVFVSMSDD